MAPDSPLELIVGYAFSIALFLPPCYYVWAFIAALRRRRNSSPWLALVCLLSWFAQWPAMLWYVAGCMGGGCAGVRPKDIVTAILVVGYNFGPAYWLWRRSRM